jgi:regulator of protease activity HflC (stomatin/prohibitin superfamily)
MDVIVSFQAWRVTGVFTLPRSPLQAEARREALVTLAQLDAEVTRLRSEASRTTQVARRADINVALKRLREARAAAEANL